MVVTMFYFLVKMMTKNHRSTAREMFAVFVTNFFIHLSMKKKQHRTLQNDHLKSLKIHRTIIYFLMRWSKFSFSFWRNQLCMYNNLVKNIFGFSDLYIQGSTTINDLYSYAKKLIFEEVCLLV